MKEEFAAIGLLNGGCHLKKTGLAWIENIFTTVNYTSEKIGLCFKMLEAAVARILAEKIATVGSAADLRILLRPHRKSQLKTKGRFHAICNKNALNRRPGGSFLGKP